MATQVKYKILLCDIVDMNLHFESNVKITIIFHLQKTPKPNSNPNLPPINWHDIFHISLLTFLLVVCLYFLIKSILLNWFYFCFAIGPSLVYLNQSRVGLIAWMKIVCHVMKECIDKVDMAIKYILYLEFRDLICGLSVYQFNLQHKEQMWTEQFSGRSM